MTDGLSNTVFMGESSSILPNKTWFGVVPWSCTPPRNPPVGIGDTNSGGCLVGVHSGPDVHDHPNIIIHAPDNPFGHTDEMYSQHAAPGCNVLFGDGSVRYVTAFVNPYTWRGAFDDEPGRSHAGRLLIGCGAEFQNGANGFGGGRPWHGGPACLFARLIRKAAQMAADKDVYKTVDALFTAVTCARRETARAMRGTTEGLRGRR